MEKILNKLRNHTPDYENDYELDEILQELWKTGKQDQATQELFLFIERFPEDSEDYDLFRLVHAFEQLKNFEEELIKSLDRIPSYIGLLLVKRIANSGRDILQGREIVNIYLDALNDPLIPESTKEALLYWMDDKKKS